MDKHGHTICFTVVPLHVSQNFKADKLHCQFLQYLNHAYVHVKTCYKRMWKVCQCPCNQAARTFLCTFYVSIFTDITESLSTEKIKQ